MTQSCSRTLVGVTVASYPDDRRMLLARVTANGHIHATAHRGHRP